jgi:hypothetical protein
VSENPGFPAVAIVGMSCRFPGAPDPDAYWALLREGRESIHRFTHDELLAAGVPAAEEAHTPLPSHPKTMQACSARLGDIVLLVFSHTIVNRRNRPRKGVAW